MADDQANDQLPPTDPAQWQIECENATFLVTSLLRLTRRSCDSAVVIELLRTIPKTWSGSTEHDELGLFYRQLGEAFNAKFTEPRLYQAFRDSLERFRELAPAKRAMIEASVIGTILGGGMG